MLNPLAQELNEILKNSVAFPLFSKMGKRMFFPKGIISQSAEAKKFGKKANGTIGMTFKNNKPVILSSIQNILPTLSSSEIVAYAPTAGFPEIRETWHEKQIMKNPLLKNVTTSTPVVTAGLTAGISYISDLFLDEDRPLLTAKPFWGNYNLIAQTRRGSEIHKFNIFEKGKFNIAGLKTAIEEESKSGSVRLLLNFPQNPTGYTPLQSEMDQICALLNETAKKGTKLLVLCDDAYFGLNYEDNIASQSLFAHIANMNKNILAVKIDGPTKEDFAWGLRCGFITFGCKGMTTKQYEALNKKLMGVIRSSISCSATPSQTLLLHAFKDSSTEKQKLEFRAILKNRYLKVKDFIKTHTSKYIEPMPFNSGYFMSLHLIGINAEQLRQKLLFDKQIGTIAIDGETLRIAFSSLDENDIETVYSAVYETADEIAKN